MNVPTPAGTSSLTHEAKRMAHHWAQYGALGMMVASFMAVLFYLVYTFVPVLKDGLVTRFQTDELAKTNQTAAMQKIANAMEKLEVHIDTSAEVTRSAISLTCARRR